jgi:putative ABC transport system ATP-binding protein
MKDDIITISGVSRTFSSGERKYAALRNISLTIARGEYLGIIGKSGSGKSTLLNMITGIDKPDEGSVTVNGTNICELTENRLATWRGKNTGIVFQFFQLIPTLTIRENLLLPMEFTSSVPHQMREERAKELLIRTGILPHADKLPSSLSGGEQQRAAIARALACDPPVIIADEPTGNLDSITASAVHALFRSLADEGKTVIIVTHEQNPDLRYDRIVTIADGEIKCNETKLQRI